MDHPGVMEAGEGVAEIVLVRRPRPVLEISSGEVERIDEDEDEEDEHDDDYLSTAVDAERRSPGAT